ncbi:MAG: hypothetical protein Q4F54_05125 [Coriobacteriia bacterium]|nr:hypothetical protein [Coriobacteriia bacterium]
MDILSSGGMLMPLDLVKDNEEVYGAFSNLVPKFGYTATVEAGSHTSVSHTGDLDVPFDANGTVVSVDENNSIYFASPSVTKPGLHDEGSSLDYDTSIQIDSTGTDGYEVAY